MSLCIFEEIHSRLYNPRLVQTCSKFCNMSCRPITLYSGYVEIYILRKNFSGNGPTLIFETRHTLLSVDIATNVPNFEEVYFVTNRDKN